jgi:hypothetical protein
MTPLQLQIKTTVAGAIASDLPDQDFLEVLRSIIEEGDSEIDTEEAARIVRKSPITLKKWRAKGVGPKFRKDPNGFISYRKSWLQEFMEQGEVVENQSV